MNQNYARIQKSNTGKRQRELNVQIQRQRWCTISFNCPFADERTTTVRILQRSLTVKVGAENLYKVYGINMARGAVKTRKRTLNGRRRDLRLACMALNSPRDSLSFCTFIRLSFRAPSFSFGMHRVFRLTLTIATIRCNCVCLGESDITVFSRSYSSQRFVEMNGCFLARIFRKMIVVNFLIFFIGLAVLKRLI